MFERIFKPEEDRVPPNKVPSVAVKLHVRTACCGCVIWSYTEPAKDHYNAQPTTFTDCHVKGFNCADPTHKPNSPIE